MMEADN